MQRKTRAVAAPKKLPNGEVRTGTRPNGVRRDAVSDRPMSAIARDDARAVDALPILQALVQIARDLAAAPGDDLDDRARAFHDAPARTESAVEMTRNANLRMIATARAATMRHAAGRDWRRRDTLGGRTRARIRRGLKRHGSPPDLQADALSRVIRRVEALAQALGRAA